MQCLLAMCRDVGTEVVLIGRLVVREPRVAIEPIRAVLYRQVTNRRDSATWQAKVTFKEQQQVVELEISKELPPGYVGARAGQR